MAIDISENVAASTLNAGAQAFQALMTDLAGNIAFASNLARLQAQQRFGEMDAAESRALSGLIATPIASPTTQDKA